MIEKLPFGFVLFLKPRLNYYKPKNKSKMNTQIIPIDLLQAFVTCYEYLADRGMAFDGHKEIYEKYLTAEGQEDIEARAALWDAGRKVKKVAQPIPPQFRESSWESYQDRPQPEE